MFEALRLGQVRREEKHEKGRGEILDKKRQERNGQRTGKMNQD